MGLSRDQKVAQSGEVRDRFSRAVSTVLVDFSGVSVGTITDLRARFRAAGVEYKVVKNNVVLKAIEGTSLADNKAFTGQLKGQTGIAWSYEDPSAAAKIIKAFRKEGDAQGKVLVKAGVVESTVFVGPKAEEDLAAIPGKDEIRAQLLAQLMAPAESLVRLLNAPGQNLALVLDAYKRKQEGG
ncbi:MAG: 50S ribosomal protein L10 [Polyangiales bacterium]